MSDDTTIQQWIAALDSDDVDTRHEAINRLGEAKATDAVPKLIELLDDDEFSVQMAAVDALGQIGDAQAIAALAKIAQEETGPLQSQAATALFAINTPESLAAIGHLRKDDDSYELGGAVPGAPPLDDALDDDEGFTDFAEEVEEAEEAEKSSPVAADVEDAVVLQPKTEEPKPQAPPPAPTPAPAPEPAAPAEPEAERNRRQASAEPAKSSPTLTGGGNQSLEEAVKEAQEVQFSAYYPREVRPNEWQPLQAYVFKKFAESNIAEDAAREIGPLDAFRRIVERARHTIAEGDMISATPTLPGFQFNPPQVTIGFYEDWHRLSFKLRATDAPLNQAANGFLTFTANGLIVADVPLSVFVTHDITQKAPQASESRPVYDTVFASYSHRDTHIVERVEAAAKTLGLTYLRDVITLRSGENWSDQLLEMIEQATIFQLFWSAESAKSPHCRMEWEHAVKLNRQQGNFVRPVYWSQPMAPPPQPLQHIHFAYMPDLVN